MINQEIKIVDLDTNQAKEIQKMLQALDYYHDSIDGIPGKNTAHAWAEFKADQWQSKTNYIGPGSYQLLLQEFKEAKPRVAINWYNFDCKISKYFTVGEVALRQNERIPTNPQHQANAIKMALKLDEIREWWGSPLLVNSWYRPPHVERRVGGSGANHPFGYAVDFRPAQGSVWTLQRRFEDEWYNTGKWQGGFGRGAKKNFLHLDLRHRRIWDY